MNRLNMKRSYDLIIVTGEPFPQGKAATNRIICYAGKMAATRKVLLLTYAAPVYNSELSIPSKGQFQGVEYEYIHEASIKYKPNKLIRFLSLCFRYIGLCYKLLFQYRCKSLIYVSRNMLLALILKIILLLNKVRFYREISETPENIKNEIKKAIVSRLNIIFDGFIVISIGIREYLSFIKDDGKFFILPVLVQIERFSGYENVRKERYFCYCSGANLERDGFLDIINGFLKFRESNNNYELQVATSFNLNDSYHKAAYDIMMVNSTSIKYLGVLPTTEIPNKLMKASVLLLTPHRNYLTRGFPTKLGEYLASGTPVICSSINDLVEQLNVDSVKLVHPNAPQEICDALHELVNDRSIAKAIGDKGRKMVVEKYTMDSYILPLLSFLNI